MTSRANPPHGWSPEMAASPFALVTPIYWGQMWSAATTEFTADHSRQKVGAFFLHFPGFSSAPTWLCTPGRPLIYSAVLAACSFGPRPSLIAPSPPGGPLGDHPQSLPADAGPPRRWCLIGRLAIRYRPDGFMKSEN